MYLTDPAWYQTWPAPGSRPSGNQKTPASQHPQNWSATWTKDSKRREKRWVKYEGIGPVDESGMPIAPRSVSPGLGPLMVGTQGPTLSSTSPQKLYANHARLKPEFSQDGLGGRGAQEPHKIMAFELQKWFWGGSRLPPRLSVVESHY